MCKIEFLEVRHLGHRKPYYVRGSPRQRHEYLNNMYALGFNINIKVIKNKKPQGVHLRPLLYSSSNSVTFPNYWKLNCATTKYFELINSLSVFSDAII